MRYECVPVIGLAHIGFKNDCASLVYTNNSPVYAQSGSIRVSTSA